MLKLSSVRSYVIFGSIILLPLLIVVVSSLGIGDSLIPRSQTSKAIPLPTDGSINLIDNQRWQMAGVSMGQNGNLIVSNMNLNIVKKDGSPGQANPPVNLFGVRLNVSGDFSVLADLSSLSNPVAISLYGRPPLIEDEFRAETDILDINIASNRLVVGMSNQINGLLTSQQIVNIAVHSKHSLTISDIGGKLSFSLDGHRVGNEMPDLGLFSSNQVWFGMDARTPGNFFSIDRLIARPLNDGRVSLVDASKLTIKQDTKGLAFRAQKIRPNFLIGAAVAPGAIVADDGYRSLLGNFNSYTTENVGKFQFIHPLPGNNLSSYNFADMDGIVNVAVQAGVQVHGHALIFGEANPKWLQDLAQQQPDQLLQTGIDHVKTVVGHYKDKVHGWDVINEPLADYDTAPGLYGLRQNIWYKAIGPNYMAPMLKAAKQADPHTELWINEFGMESDDDRFAQMISLIQRLRAEGAPLTGIGFQSHIDSSDAINNDTQIDTAKLHQRIRTLASMGLKTRFSEVDISSDSEYPIPAEILQTCLSEPTCEGMTTWGVTDKYSSSGSLNSNGIFESASGLLWDDNLQPKPSLLEINKVLN